MYNVTVPNNVFKQVCPLLTFAERNGSTQEELGGPFVVPFTREVDAIAFTHIVREATGSVLGVEAVAETSLD